MQLNYSGEADARGEEVSSLLSMAGVLMVLMTATLVLPIRSGNGWASLWIVTVSSTASSPVPIPLLPVVTPSTMAPASLSTTLLQAKRSKGISFAELETLLGRDEVWIASLLHGQSTASAEEADLLIAAFGLDPALKVDLMTPPVKGCLDPVIPTDPLIYRFYEIMQVYGLPLKDVIQEKFGDGIMSAIDFTMEVEKVENPAGDRVKVTMCGKFLPYKKW